LSNNVVIKLPPKSLRTILINRAKVKRDKKKEASVLKANKLKIKVKKEEVTLLSAPPLIAP
jgi:hypothetical protein